MGKCKVYRKNIMNQVNSVSIKSLSSVLRYEAQFNFGLDPTEAEIVARKGHQYIKNCVSRTEEQIIVPAVSGRTNHKKRSFSSLPKTDVTLTVFSHDDLELLQEFGLQFMQLARLARIIEEAYYQDAIFPLEQLSVFLNLSIGAIRRRLACWWNEKIIMPICGQNISTRSSCNVLRPVYAVRKHLVGQSPEVTRKFLALTTSQYNDYLLGFAKVSKAIRSGKSYEYLARLKYYPLEVLNQWARLYEEVNSTCPPLIDELLEQFRFRLSLSGESKASSSREQLLFDLQTLHNFSPSKAEAYIFSLDDHCRLLSGISRSPLEVVYYAVSHEEPACRPLNECNLLPVKLSYIDFGSDMVGRDRVREMKWIKLLRYATQARKQGALLTNCDLAFLLGIDPDVVSALIKDHPNTFVPTRGNIADIGPKLTHVEKIVSLFMEGYTETEIMLRTGHSRESVENYISTFCVTAGLLERGLSVPLIRQATKRSKRLIECHKKLYEKFNHPDYQFTMMRVRKIFARQEELSSSKKKLN